MKGRALTVTFKQCLDIFLSSTSAYIKGSVVFSYVDVDHVQSRWVTMYGWICFKGLFCIFQTDHCATWCWHTSKCHLHQWNKTVMILESQEDLENFILWKEEVKITQIQMDFIQPMLLHVNLAIQWVLPTLCDFLLFLLWLHTVVRLLYFYFLSASEYLY